MSRKKNRSRNNNSAIQENNESINNESLNNEAVVDDNLISETAVNEPLTEETLIENVPIENVSIEETLISEPEVDETIADVLTVDSNENITEEMVNEPAVDQVMEDNSDSATYGSFVNEEKKEKKAKKKLEKNKEAKSGESFGEFLKEFFAHVKTILVNNKKTVGIIAIVAAVVAVVITVISLVNKNPHNEQSVSDQATDSASASDNLVVPEDPYETDAYPEVNELISKYYAARQSDDIATLKQLQLNLDEVEAAKYQVLSNYIDEYTLKNCYTKKGPFDNSYIVYATFEVKMAGYDVLAPGLQTFVICTKEEDGSLYIYSGDFEPSVATYISEISAQQDVNELMNRISVEYNDILASNEDFANYMNTFKSLIKSEIGVKIAELEVSSSESSNNADDTTSDAGSESDNAVSSNNASSFSVKTTTSVNIRKSDSENADKLDTVGAGTVLVCRKEIANGWSEIEYNGQIGYIKTEFVERVDGDGAGNTVATNGSVMINETIKIRKEPSTDSDSIGVGYAGQTFEKIESMDNGWTKILFEGKEAYIKSEFIVQ